MFEQCNFVSARTFYVLWLFILFPGHVMVQFREAYISKLIRIERKWWKLSLPSDLYPPPPETTTAEAFNHFEIKKVARRSGGYVYGDSRAASACPVHYIAGIMDHWSLLLSSLDCLDYSRAKSFILCDTSAHSINRDCKINHTLLSHDGDHHWVQWISMTKFGEWLFFSQGGR